MATSGTATVTLPKDEEILITRHFDAPRHLVYEAWTAPELVERWWSGRQGSMKSVEIDLRVGGRWRYVMEANEGFEIAFHGEYRELIANERIVTTEVFEGMPGEDPPPAMPGDEVLNVITFAEVEDSTDLELLIQCPSKEIRDGILGSGMEVGMQEQFDALEALAATLE